MKLGTKSLLFGVHQFIIHPIVVLIAWIKLYGLPNYKELICIIIHDWGYWGKTNMDGLDGKSHPEIGAKIANKLFGRQYYELCLYHSRSYASKYDVEPSKLCWADKLSIKYEIWWFYLLRAKLTMELLEYRNLETTEGFASLKVTNKEWFEYGKDYLVKQALEQSNFVHKT